MGTVTISTVDYTIYGEHTGAGSLTAYAGGSLLFATVFSGASSDNQKRALVEATRFLDRQLWQGSKVSDAQAQAWPRSDVTDPEGAAVDDGSIPQFVIDACYELALAGLQDSSIFGSTSTGKNVQSVGAGAASVSFFAPVAGSRFPDRVMELVGPYLGSSASGDLPSSGAGASLSYGTDGTSAFDDCDTYERSAP